MFIGVTRINLPQLAQIFIGISLSCYELGKYWLRSNSKFSFSELKLMVDIK